MTLPSQTPQLDSFQAVQMMQFNPASLTGTFQPINFQVFPNGTLSGTSGFSDNVKILKVFNASGTSIDISYDGVNPHDIWPAGATLIIDLQTNHNCNPPYGSGTLNGRAGQIIWGRTSVNPTYVTMAGYR